MATENRTVLAVDGNALAHRSYHALKSTGLTTKAGVPTWAVKGFFNLLLSSLERTGAGAVIVGFDDPFASRRREVYPEYKAGRSDKAPELISQLALIREVLSQAGVPVVTPDGLEADDVVASVAAYAPQVGWNTVIVTSDRDAFALIDEHTRVLRLLNGGVGASPILTPQRLTAMLGIGPHLYRQYAALRGDPSDNLPGIRGIGEVAASKILTEFGSVQAAFDDVDAGGARVAATIGKAGVAKLANADGRAAFERNINLMTMRTDVPLGVDLTTTGQLPLAPGPVRDALATVELASLYRAADAVLCGGASKRFVPQPPAGWEPPPPAGWEPPPPPDDALFPPEPWPAPAPMGAGNPLTGSTAPRPTTWDALL